MSTRPVLVVDDDDAIRDALSEVLADAGYAVETARDGQEALDRLRRGPSPRKAPVWRAGQGRRHRATAPPRPTRRGAAGAARRGGPAPRRRARHRRAAGRTHPPAAVAGRAARRRRPGAARAPTRADRRR